MVREGIVLGHLVSERGIEVDKAKIEVIEQLPPPINIRGIQSFRGHAGFYHCFIKDFELKDFSHIARPLTLRKHSSLHQSFNPLIGRYLLKSCVMLVIMLWGQFLDKLKIRSIMRLLMLVKH
jgi:hypothetical protein